MSAIINVKFLGDSKALETAAATVESKLKSISGAGIASVAGLAGAAAGIGGALIGVGRQFEAAYDGLRVKTGETGAALKGLEDSTKNVFKGTPASLETVSQAIGSFHQKLGLSGKPLEALSAQVISLSRITKTDLKENIDAVSGTFQNWSVSTDRQRETLNVFFRASQQSGLSVAELSGKVTEAGTTLRQFGMSLEQATALTATMAKGGVDITDVMPALSKELAHAAKEGKNAGEVFKEAFDKIKSAPDDTTAAGEALTTFGAKGGPKLAAMIREGKLSYEEMLKTITSGGDTIAAAGKDTAHFSGAWTKLTHEVLVAVEPIATKMFLALDDGMKKIIPPIKDVIANMEPLREKLREIFDFVTSHKEVLIGLSVAIGTGLVVAFGMWAASAAAAAAATLAAAAPVIAVAVAIGALVAGVIYAYNHWKIFKGTIDTVWMVLRDYVWPAIQKVVEIIRDALVVYFRIAAAEVKLVWEAFQTMWHVASGVFEQVKGAVEGFITLFTGIGSKLANAGAGMWDWVKDTFKTAINGVIDIWNNVKFPAFKIGGWDTPFGKLPSYTTPEITLPHINYLAKGGLATKPMLAVIGDTVGDSEIVSPTKLMRQIVREESGNGAGVVINGGINMGIQATPADLVRELSWYAKQTRH